MKKFLILSYSISGMGGGQMYQYNKLKFMKKNGYETYIFYAISGEIIIKEIEDVAKVCHVDSLNTDPRILNKKEIQSILSEMSNMLGCDNTELIVECCNKNSSLWGEMLAEKLHGFSYSLIIDEKIGSIDNQLKDFFRFKRDRDELKGLKNETYEMIFDGEKVPSTYQYCLRIAGNNVVADVEYKNPVETNYDFKICSIGRLDKEYNLTLVDQIVLFAKNTDLKLFFCMIGDSPNHTDIDRIKEKFESVPNVDLYLYGSVYPIPKNLLNEFDIFISSAGSARVSGDRGLPTITIDSRDHMSIGIYQYETENTVFRQVEPKIPISEKLQYVVNHYEEIKRKLYVKPKVDFDSIFRKHLEYYEAHNDVKKYYDVLSMKLSKGKMLEKIIYSVFGKSIYEEIRKIAFSRIQR